MSSTERTLQIKIMAEDIHCGKCKIGHRLNPKSGKLECRHFRKECSLDAKRIYVDLLRCQACFDAEVKK